MQIEILSPQYISQVVDLWYEGTVHKSHPIKPVEELTNSLGFQPATRR